MSVSDPYNICVQDTTKFTRLQVAALEGQVSRPLTSTKLQKLSIERKSMDSLEKDFIKYTGDAERSTSEVRHDSLTSPHPITSLILSTSSGPARILDNPGRLLQAICNRNFLAKDSKVRQLGIELAIAAVN